MGIQIDLVIENIKNKGCL